VNVEFRGAGGSNFVDPLAPVLQIENKHHAAHDFLLLQKPFKNKFSTVFSKQKPPCGGVCFLLDRGAGGSRTRVQTWKSYAFYMLISA